MRPWIESSSSRGARRAWGPWDFRGEPVRYTLAQAVTEPGDIIVLQSSDGPRALVDEVGGCAIAAPAQAIRIDATSATGAALDPRVCGAFLADAENTRIATGTSTGRANLTDLELPILDAEAVRRLVTRSPFSASSNNARPNSRAAPKHFANCCWPQSEQERPRSYSAAAQPAALPRATPGRRNHEALERDPARAQGALRNARRRARTVLAEMRRLLSVLRDDDSVSGLATGANITATVSATGVPASGPLGDDWLSLGADVSPALAVGGRDRGRDG
jgi:hypothetical protein